MPDGAVPELEIVAIRQRTVAGHEHIVAVKLADGREQEVEQVIAAIKDHEAHYVMRTTDGTMPSRTEAAGLPLLVQVRQCPDCDAEAIYA